MPGILCKRPSQLLACSNRRTALRFGINAANLRLLVIDQLELTNHIRALQMQQIVPLSGPKAFREMGRPQQLKHLSLRQACAQIAQAFRTGIAALGLSGLLDRVREDDLLGLPWSSTPLLTVPAQPAKPNTTARAAMRIEEVLNSFILIPSLTIDSRHQPTRRLDHASWQSL